MNDHHAKTAANSGIAIARDILNAPTLDRTTLRRDALARRDALPVSSRVQAAVRINQSLWQLLSALPPATLGFCWPIRSEVDCQPAVVRLLDAGWLAAMPVVIAAAAPMQFRRWAPDVAMSVDRHGIPVPAEGAIALASAPALPLPTVWLLPLVAYDTAGYRLGYGGGYFDRTLATCAVPPLTLGIGYAATRLASIAPQAHDIPLDGVVTERGLERFSEAAAALLSGRDP